MITHDIAEAISVADKIIVLSKGPATIKSIYNIELNNKECPSVNRNDSKFNYYNEMIWRDLDSNE